MTLLKINYFFNVIQKVYDSFISLKFLKYHIMVHMKNLNLIHKHAELS
jgi:hypothetical protein